MDGLRQQARKHFEQGATGLQTAAYLSQHLDAFLTQVFQEVLSEADPALVETLRGQTALVATGGTARGDVCPYSDIDLLFLHSPSCTSQFEKIASQVQRDLWDSGLKIGASVRTVADSLSWARQEIQFATSLVDTRLLWGNQAIFGQLQVRFARTIIKSRSSEFLAEVSATRSKERAEFGASTQQLEPDVKRSVGGLRDLHFIRWVGFALYGSGEIDALQRHGALNAEDARRLSQAHEFLIAIRINLHFAANKEQDTLSRDDQLRIARSRNIPAIDGLRPVERFMQEYFQHSSFIADVARQFMEQTQHKKILDQAFDFLMSYRVDEIYRVGPEQIDIPRGRTRRAVCGNLERVLHLYLTAARYGRTVAPRLAAMIKSEKIKTPAVLSPDASQLFLELLKTTGKLGEALRGLHENGVLEAVLPCFQHIRCLLQFNQYHHYTVDEHTLRAIEAAEGFLGDTGAVGRAYREIHHKELLHLSILLHDAGKGYEEDHSEVGRRIAADVAVRLGLPAHQRELVMFLVHRHLKMADLALRRDINDPAVLLKFSHEVGSPESLRMLYVLTAADISAVGPGVWTQWKAELTTTLYERTMLWLSGKSHLFDEPTRLMAIKEQVAKLIAGAEPIEPSNGTTPSDQNEDSLAEELDQFPAHYLLETPPARIADDYRLIQSCGPDQILVEAVYDAETSTVEYRIITHERLASGCFHKVSGVLSAKRLVILSAAIYTTQDGVIIDVFRVRDTDHVGEIPGWRVDELAVSIRKVLRGEAEVETLLRSRGKFALSALSGPVSDLPMRVVIDNESSDRYTIIDVFAHDRPGLLYAITKALYELKLSVVLAKIATHFDQVLDVFFVTDADNGKITAGDRLTEIPEVLTKQLASFEESARDEQ
ncbi:[protein-PII] uridylyltransferase [Schlesneria sp.]|uniref:[protein-PII] uridylyltransferase n=1 Tax=Schlesneria sp. TaxID=2762018 RepID=UPI002F0D8BDE